MTNSVPKHTGSIDAGLADLVDELTAKIQAGDAPDLEEYAVTHPAYADRLRELWPALHLMVELGPPASPSGTVGPAPGFLADFRIVREVGRGGMGVVYEAEQVSLGRRVALKVLPFAATIDPRQLKRFQNEARAAASLHHEHIVPVYGVGCERGIHYYAMQFIDGRPLSDLIARLGDGTETAASDAGAATDPAARAATLPDFGGKTYWRWVAELGVQAAEALEYAHSMGVVHRDVKPGNLLLDSHGKLWVADFGLAKLGADAGVTMTGDLLGTLRYMSPEQALAKHGLLDQRTDVYSLGASLYELLTRAPAFGATDRQELLRQIAFEEPPPPRHLNRTIPAELETVVRKAMEKEPGGRYASAQELADDLKRFLNDEPIKARPPTVVQRVRRWGRRNRAITAVSVVAILLGALSVVGGLMAALMNRERNSALANLERAERAEQDYHAEHDRTMERAHLAQARAHRWSGRVGQRLDAIKELTAAARLHPSLELRNEAVASLALTDLRFVRSWEVHPTDTSAFVFDTRFERYAQSDKRGNIAIYRVSDGQELARLHGPGTHAFSLRFSPDGEYLVAVYHEGTGLVWHVSRGQCVWTMNLLGEFGFSPDCRQVAFSPNDGDVHICNLATGTIEKRVKSGFGSHNLVFSPDGLRLAVTRNSNSRSIEIHDLAAGKAVQTLPHREYPGAMDWRPDGRFLASTSDDTIYVWDLRTGKQQAMLRGHESRVTRLQFSHRGDLLASSGWDNTLRLWNPMTGQLLLTKEGTIYPAQISPDERPLVGTMGGSRAEMWEVVQGGRVCCSLCGPAQSGSTSFANFSADGRLLAVADDHGIRLWDTVVGRDVAFLPTGNSVAVFHSSGRSLFVAAKRGLECWPVGPHPDLAVGGLRVGPAQLLERSALYAQLSLDRGGRWAAVIDWARDRALVLDLEHKEVQVALGKHSNICMVAMSPDCHWVATASSWGFTGPLAKLWDARSGQLAWEVPKSVGQGDARPAFSPDGRWLVIALPQEYRFFHVGSWRPGPVIPRETAANSLCAPAFSPDGRLVAVAHSSRLIRLLNTDTFEELATLGPPDRQRVFHLAFSPDSGRLAASCDNQLVLMWDLRLIRQELSRSGLDWNTPPWPPTPAFAGIRDPLHVAIDSGGSAVRLAADDLIRRAQDHIATSHFGKALELLEQAVRTDPDNADAHHSLALLLATCPDSKYRDARRAVESAQLAVDLGQTRQETAFRITLGIAYYRAGEWKAAQAALEQSVALRDGGDSYDWFFLAMVHWRLGDKAEARRWYRKAVDWMEKTEPKDADLLRFRAEAEALLEIKKK